MEINFTELYETLREIEATEQRLIELYRSLGHNIEIEILPAREPMTV